MSKYTRVPGKLFGANATATGDDPEIGQFGSALAGAYRGTTDIATIQNLPAWGKGFISSVVPNMQYPPLPEVTGALKVLSYQENYLLQNGIPEWDNTTDYYVNSFCQRNGIIYRSLSDNNVGNDPENSPQHWTEDIFNGANKDLSNLTTYGNNRLHALKGYLDNGELLTDREGLEDVNYFSTSKFDKTKFTFQGTPKISNDGVMSNITPNNYAKIDTSNITYSKSLEIIFPIRRTSLNSAQWFASSGSNVAANGGIWLGFSETNQLRFFASSDNGSYDIANDQRSGTIYLNELTKYYIKLVFTGEKYIISYSKNKINWTEAIVVDSSTIAPINNVNLFLGYGHGTAYFRGGYFLNEVLIKADGKPVFTGNVTGIDTVKPANYTPVGSPTITDDGIATFAANKYITLPEIDVTGKTFEIDFGKITPNNVTTTQVILSGISPNLLTVGIAGSNSRIFATSTNWDDSINTDPLTANNTYYLKVGYDGTNAYLSLSANGINYTKTTKELTTQFTTLSLRIGTKFDGTVPILFPYDLNQYKIYVDNKLVYQPCLLIPYAESSTGSKIVDNYYRDRVVDVYNQYGVANYYTLSGSDFTLPMGEIYGMMNPQTTEAPKIKNYGIREHGSLTKSGNVISGFSTSNYGEIPNVFAPADNPWEINLKFTTGNDVTTMQAIITGFTSITGPVEFWISNSKFLLSLSSNGSSMDICGGETGSYTVEKNTTYYSKLKFTGTHYIVSYSTNGSTYTDDIDVESSVSIFASRIGLGIDYGVYNYTPGFYTPFLGSFDLLGWNILVNNVLFWQGSTPLDNVYPTSAKPAVVVDAYVRNKHGYRIWSDGYCEQWGFTYNENQDVYLLIEFVDENYNLTLQCDGLYANAALATAVREQTSKTFKWTLGDIAADGSEKIFWRACGYIK